MAADEDNFDIDIYGDGEGEGDLGTESGQMDFKVEEEEEGHNFEAEHDETALAENTEDNLESEQQQQSHGFDGTEDQGHRQTEHQESSNNEPVAQVPTPQQGTKRKESSDDRPIDHGATTALMISDLHWWITEDDIRGWANEAAAEDELKDISFSEHKVNGKSKGCVHENWLRSGRDANLIAVKHMSNFRRYRLQQRPNTRSRVWEETSLAPASTRSPSLSRRRTRSRHSRKKPPEPETTARPSVVRSTRQVAETMAMVQCIKDTEGVEEEVSIVAEAATITITNITAISRVLWEGTTITT